MNRFNACQAHVKGLIDGGSGWGQYPDYVKGPVVMPAESGLAEAVGQHNFFTQRVPQLAGDL